MRFKLTPELCYLAGLAGKSSEPERSAVGIRTQDERIEEKFIKSAMKLGVDSTKIMIEAEGTFKHVHFYHSKLARMIREVMNERSSLPEKKGGEAASAFLAGLFDGSVHIMPGSVTIRRIDKSDELMLERLNIHTSNGRVRNVKRLIELVRGQSVLADQMNNG